MLTSFVASLLSFLCLALFGEQGSFLATRSDVIFISRRVLVAVALLVVTVQLKLLLAPLLHPLLGQRLHHQRAVVKRLFAASRILCVHLVRSWLFVEVLLLMLLLLRLLKVRVEVMSTAIHHVHVLAVLGLQSERLMIELGYA